MFRNDPAYAEKAQKIASLAKDVTEVVKQFGLPPASDTPDLVVAYHSACSMQHGQQLRDEPKSLLKQAGFVVRDVPEGHICCGSAGTYNLLQPEIAGRLRERKVGNILKMRPEVIATGNLGGAAGLGDWRAGACFSGAAGAGKTPLTVLKTVFFRYYRDQNRL